MLSARIPASRGRHTLRPGVVFAQSGGAVANAVNLIKTAETLVPYSRDSVNLGILTWNMIDQVAPEHRIQMLEQLTNADIMRMWRLAGERNKATVSELASSKVPSYSIWEDMPKEEGSIAVFKGRTVLPLRLFGLDGFDKGLFLRSENVYGRVFHGNVIGNRIYPGPLYFKAQVGSAFVPLISDTCDLVLSYELDTDALGDISSVASAYGWPAPRASNPGPFNNRFTDYIRVVGPGVFVGLGYQEDQPLADGNKLMNVFPRPLFFTMIRCY